MTRPHQRSRGTSPLGATSPQNGNPHPSAPLVRRLAALFYDWILLLGVFFLTTLVLLAFRGGEAFPAGHPAYLGALYGSGQLFFSWFWSHGGQTLGMRAWKIKLVTIQGADPSWTQTLLRGAFAVIAATPMGLGYWWAAIDPRGRTLQDIASGTRIIRS